MHPVIHGTPQGEKQYSRNYIQDQKNDSSHQECCGQIIHIIGPSHERTGKRKIDPYNEIADGQYSGPHFGTGNPVDIVFQYRSGITPYQVKCEQNDQPGYQSGK